MPSLPKNVTPLGPRKFKSSRACCYLGCFCSTKIPLQCSYLAKIMSLVFSASTWREIYGLSFSITSELLTSSRAGIIAPLLFLCLHVDSAMLLSILIEGYVCTEFQDYDLLNQGLLGHFNGEESQEWVRKSGWVVGQLCFCRSSRQTTAITAGSGQSHQLK